MDFNKLLLRSLLVFLVVASGACATVYFAHDWFHSTLANTLNLAQPVADTVGTFVLVAAAFFAQRMVSLTIYQDYMLGLNKNQSKDENKLENFHKVAEEVCDELKQVHDFNEVVRSQLRNVIGETEKAAFTIVERLQTIDTVVTHLAACRA